MAIANEPVIPADPPKAMVFDPAEPGLVPVKGVTVSVPVQAVPPPVRVKTLVPKPAVADPAPQVTTGAPAKSAANPVYVTVSVFPVVIPPAGRVMLKLCVALTLTFRRSRVSLRLVGGAARAGRELNWKRVMPMMINVDIFAKKHICFCVIILFLNPIMDSSLG